MANLLVPGRDEYGLGLEETELRLGLPGGGGGEGDVGKNSGKRGFSETIDLKLKLHTSKEVVMETSEKTKRSPPSQKNILPCTNDPEKPPAPKYAGSISSLCFSLSCLILLF